MDFRIFLVFLFTNLTVFSQSIWYPTGGPLGGYCSYISYDSSHLLYSCSIDLYTSSNSGNNWIRSSQSVENPKEIQFHPNGTRFILTYNSGLYRSIDNGNSWQMVSFPPGIYMRPGEFLIGPNGNIFTGFQMQGLLRSSNNGINWYTAIDSASILTIANDKSGRMYAGALWGGFYRSLDSGITWSRTAFADTSVYSIACDSLDNVYICREATIFKSTDLGLSWSFSGSGLPLWQGMVIYHTSGGYLFAGGGFGVYRSSDEGNSWQNFSNGICQEYVTGFFELPTGEVFMGTVGDGLLSTTDHGLTWQPKNNGMYSSWVQSVFSYGNTIIAGTSFEGVYISSNSGLYWQQTNLALCQSSYNSISKDSSGVLYVSANTQIHRSIDTGRTWVHYTDVPGGEIMMIGFNRAGDIFVQSDLTGLKRSTDGGSNWVSLSAPFGSIEAFGINHNGDIYIQSSSALYRSTTNGNNWITIYPSFNEGNFYFSYAFGSSGDVYALSDYKIRRSTNNGQNWQVIFNSTDVLSALVIDPYNSLFALDNYGGKVFMSSNNGVNWADISAGLDSYPYGLTITSNGISFLATSRGVYSTYHPIGIRDELTELPRHFALYQNYPNPFNPNTRIRVDITKKAFTQLIIYDVQGKVVQNLFEGELHPGEYVFDWEASGFSSGIYFCKMVADDFTQSRKMVLLK